MASSVSEGRERGLDSAQAHPSLHRAELLLILGAPETWSMSASES